MPVVIPEVRGYGELNKESFESYYARWPAEFSSVPKCVVENWIYRHWANFQAWLPLRPLEWKYELTEYSNEQIMTIDHFGDWLDTLDYWGSELFRDKMRRDTWLAQYMLRGGTTPVPIMVAVNAGQVCHPRGCETDLMKEPYQLIEGHMRLAYLRGMIRRGYGALKPTHSVWAITIPPNHSFKADGKM